MARGMHYTWCKREKRPTIYKGHDMTSQQLSHPSTQLKVLHACRNAMAWGIDHVRTRKGHAYLAVRYNSTSHEFTILDRTGACQWEDLFFAVPAGHDSFDKFLFNRVTCKPNTRWEWNHD